MSLTLCRASAGTGKTYAICEEVARAVDQDGLDPARVIATTFTTRASSELKGRILARLLEASASHDAPGERFERAERLELAIIGTVDSIALRLLQRYALALGLSPRLRVADDAAAARLLDEALTGMPAAPWDELAAAGWRMGIQQPRTLARALLALQRTNDISDDAFLAQLDASAERVCALLAPQGPDPEAGDIDQLPVHVEHALQRLRTFEDDVGKTRDAVEALERLKQRSELTWYDTVACVRVEAGKRSGADASLEALRSFAAGARRMPRLHDEVRRFVALLGQQTVALGRAYREHKERRGLLDFVDLESHLLQLLRQPDVADDLAASFDLLVVDEFQDTNPVQLAIFLRLHDIVGRSVWVGDEKQAIYGFRGADTELIEAVWAGEGVDGARDGTPELVEALLESPVAERRTLARNRRSQAGLVDLFNRVFEPVFGPTAHLEPHRPALQDGVERWLLPVRNQTNEAMAITAGVAALRDEGVPLRDIAVLVRLNDRGRILGEALRASGIPVRTPMPGLLRTRECAAALAGLRVVVDAKDTVAVAEVLHLLSRAGDATPAWLEDRLRAMRDGDGPRWAEQPVLRPLQGIDATRLPPAEALAAVIHALDLPHRVAAWGEPERRASNLDALLALAATWQDDALSEGRAATAAGLTAGLSVLAREGKDLLPTPTGQEAVTVLTYHASKGLEWPVVVLTGLDFEPRPDPWRPIATGGHPTEGDPLRGRQVRAWVWPFGTSKGLFPRRAVGTGLEQDALVSPEGVALASSEEREARRLLYVGMTRARDRLVLAHRWRAGSPGHGYGWLARLPIDDVLDAALPEGIHAPAWCSTSIRVRVLTENDARPRVRHDESRWISEPAARVGPTTARYRNPSRETAAHATWGAADRLAGPPPDLPRLDHLGYERLGQALHAYLAALPGLAGGDGPLHARAAARCLEAYGFDAGRHVNDLVASGERLQRWVEARYPGARWSVEVPLSAPAGERAQWFGYADLLLMLPDGSCVLVDHKALPFPEGGWAQRSPAFAGQLDAYAAALAAQGLQVRARWVHLPFAASMVPLISGAMRM